MKLRPLIILLLLLLQVSMGFGQGSTATSQNAAVARADSVKQQSTYDSTDATATDDFEPGLFLIVLACVLICIGVAFAGAVLGIGVMFILSVFFSIGVLSLSVASGIYKRSFMAGFRVFVVLAMSVLGTIGGIGVLMLANYLFDLHFTGRYLLLTGALGGLAGGLLLGVLLNWIVRTAMKWIQGRL